MSLPEYIYIGNTPSINLLKVEHLFVQYDRADCRLDDSLPRVSEASVVVLWC